MAKIGYIRCSALDQNEARQVEMMKDQNVERVYMDKASGKNTNREQLQAMMDYIIEGDIIITESISRIARNTRDLLSIVSEITEKKAEFISLKENIDTSTPQGRFMLTVFAAMAELERESILERQREGIAIAKAEGKYTGRQPIEIDEERFKTVCKRWRAGEITARSAMNELDVKPNTFYRRVKDLNL